MDKKEIEFEFERATKNNLQVSEESAFMNNFMVVNIAWNHSGWKRLEPNPKINFGFVKDVKKAALSPHEALNFDFDKENIDSSETVYGYFQTRGTPRKFEDHGLIFFYSQSTDDKKGYIIGVYGNASIIEPRKVFDFRGLDNGKFLSNIMGKKELSALFPHYLLYTDYWNSGKRLIFRSNFTYNISSKIAIQILNDELKACGQNDSALNAKLVNILNYTKNL